MSTAKAYSVAPESQSRLRPSSSMAACASVRHRLPDIDQRGHRVEQPAHAGGGRAAEPSPVSSWMPQHSALVLRTGPHRCEIEVPVQTRRPQVRKRHPIRPQHADVTARKRDVTQPGDPLVALVVGQQHSAAPDRPVRAVTCSVEGEAEYLRRAVEPVLGHHRCDVRVMVLHRSDGPVARVPMRPRGRPVGGVRRGRWCAA